MIALQWLPLWSLLGPDEGLIFIIIIFTFFITISVAFKFRSQSNMSCTLTNRNYVAQECIALTRNPFQFRLSSFKHESENVNEDDLTKDQINKSFNENNDKNVSSSKDEDIEDKKILNVENETFSDNELSNESKTKERENNSTSIDKEEVDNFRKGIKIDVFCEKDYYLCYYWGVNIDQFHNFMRLNCQSFNDRIFDGTLFDQKFLDSNKPELIKGFDQIKTIKLTCSEKVNSETLGQSPRTCYPLVVILARDLKNKENESENDVMFMINVLHVKDKICPLESNVITRLLKKRNGLTINLQTLYTPNESGDLGSNTSICVICQENLVSIALLPCRHTCTCLECFTKIDKCPLCRSYIRSYFMLKVEINEQQNESTNSNEKTASKQNKSFLKKFTSWLKH